MKIMDRREIEFDPPSVLKAIATSPKAARGFGLPNARPTAVWFHPNDGKVDVHYGVTSVARAISITAEALGVILISYCIRTRIPMPKNAAKGIRIESNSAILEFMVRFDEAPSPGFSQTIRPSAGTTRAWSKMALRD
jgi:hypothetical protein